MKYLLLLFPFFLFSCSNPGLQQQLDKAETALSEAQAKIAKLESNLADEGELVHIVLFNLKPEADQAALIAEIKKLEEIEVLKDLRVGPFENLEDVRALSDYELIMEMSFEHAADYKAYQEHPIHLALKEAAGAYMAGPPATYDFTQQ